MALVRLNTITNVLARRISLSFYIAVSAVGCFCGVGLQTRQGPYQAYPNFIIYRNPILLMRDTIREESKDPSPREPRKEASPTNLLVMLLVETH